MVWLSVGETAETVLGIVGNARRIKKMCSIDLASRCLIIDYLKETIMILIILIFILFMLS